MPYIPCTSTLHQVIMIQLPMTAKVLVALKPYRVFNI